MPRTCIVVGGGLGGLATAALLAEQGHHVTVLEKNAQVGGRASVLKLQGYTFDMGPSWYMMPEVFAQFFALFGKTIPDVYQLERLQTHYKVFFEGGRQYAIKSDGAANMRLFSELEPDGGIKLDRFLKESKYLYDQALSQLIMLNYRSLRPLLNPVLVARILSYDLFRSFHDYTKRAFRNPDLQKMLEFTTVFLGGSPYNTPAFYRLIAHADYTLGIYHPMGGMYKIVEAVQQLAIERGVIIKTNQDVTRIETVGRQAVAVHTQDQRYPADLVVANADYHYCETQLLDSTVQTHRQAYWDKAVVSPSAFLMYLGVKGKLPQLEHHNLYFGANWDEHFAAVYQDRQWPRDPSYYVHCPSRTDHSLAPADGETVIVLVPVAAGLADTPEIRRRFLQQILRHLSSLIGEEIEPRLAAEQLFTVNDFAQRYHAYRGSAFGLAHTLWQTAVFRPKNFSRKVRNLYYVGQYTNPGVGVPMVLLSAQIVAKMVKDDWT